MRNQSAACCWMLGSTVATGFLAVGVLIGVACSNQRGITPIREILAGPSHFQDSAVTVEGEVTRRFASPFRHHFYKVGDKSGSMVVMGVGFPPSVGDRVRITGVVKAAPLGLMAPILIEAVRRPPRARWSK